MTEREVQQKLNEEAIKYAEALKAKVEEHWIAKGVITDEQRAAISKSRTSGCI